MNDTPGWASPGSAPSDSQEAGVPQPSAPTDGNGHAGNWSPTQPPAGQWSPPSIPGSGHGAPPPVPGWGSRPQGSGWGQPPAAKPGVIPLRPLGVGEILDGAVSAMRAHWRTVLGITLTVSVIAQIAIILVQRYLLPEPASVDPNATGAEALRQAADSAQSTLVYSAPSTLITLIATLFTTSMLTVVISRSVLGRSVTLSEAWAEARPRLLQLLGLTLLLALMAAGIMAVGVLPGALMGSTAGVGLILIGFMAACVVVIWLMVRFCLATPALMLERQSITVSMRRSAKLVRGAWWRMFGILLLTWLLTLIVTLVIAIPFGIIAMIVDGDGLSTFLTGESTGFGWPFLIISGIGEVIISTITYPLSAGVMALLYVDQRIRREALDLELARAAGLSGYDTRS
ncbi:glycerophosphoryl diester phosphodiesterase membrane domain-containing protein [Streptomyces sp. NPDC002917]|uniref:glycerophosphoryl diester phosphodiesterase membrane domain-containing protein n=1 Tax=unclassified Streptomyces TaxID=2593676 RepID=UPI002E804CA1|nr:glycerophosphoryl diester phosphodiesterase membrane domain-containing protein [Streptomyces sp. NBC_00562]WTC81573.1 glycerophosphoryl diester phosphodiesterase membrane domain-containing protein [Streptomyces sp. NBC_01653]WTD33818.1 glycerophosphoryl diester phosphodiesterase membrane domain-containing protein [Streptomyces sp. NBC_01643]WTD89292.1 glycerophosphoryl diester phosphodiesterase membrane domain-containing protein [Streptomyces sp. NBC_01637]WUC20284.1 glycerophosphoryl dieste